MPSATPISPASQQPLFAGNVVSAGSADPAQATRTPQAVGLKSVQRDLIQAVCEHDTLEAVLDAVAKRISNILRANALCYLCRDEAHRLLPGRWWHTTASEEESAGWPAPVQACGRKACERGELQIDSSSLPEKVIVAAPVFVTGRPPEAMCAVLSGGQRLEPNAAVLQLAATHVSLWCFRRQGQGPSPATAKQLELTNQLVESQSTRQAAQTLADTLRQSTGCEQAGVVLKRGAWGSAVVEALSGVRKVDHRSELARLVEAAGQEAVMLGKLTVWTDNAQAEAGSRLTHQKLAANTGAECVVSLPLRDGQGRTEGACVLWGTRQQLAGRAASDLLKLIQTPAANCLALIQRARGGVLKNLLRSAGDLLAGRRKLYLALLTAIIAIALAVPLPHKIACDCRIQPVTRRFVAAPYDGILDGALAAAGDVVSQGQILARLDDREIRLELASLYADRAAAMKKRDSAMASHDAAKVQVARLDVERLDLKIRVLETRAEHLEVKSPIDGIVIRGDLEKAEGAPLSVGQTLFEIAPLDRMTVELAVPEDDIAYAREGMPVHFRLDAYPGRRFDGTVERVHPRAEQRDQEEVFLAEFSLENPKQLWKPGMSGRAKLVGQMRPCGWVLFHKAWEQAVMKLGW